MASFVAQVEKYDSAEAEASLVDMQQELADEVSVRAGLDATTADKLVAAKAFLADNSANIADQVARMAALDTQIREAVATNESRIECDSEYKALVTSDEYVAVADNIAKFNKLAVDLADFLVQKGRRGRPQ
jgi:hypothetical protein